MCFPVNFTKFLRTSFFTERLRTTASVLSVNLYFCELADFVFVFFIFILSN